MSPGDIVEIYEQPVDNTIPQGKAVLLQKIYENGILEFWWVQFNKKEHPKKRLVHKPWPNVTTYWLIILENWTELNGRAKRRKIGNSR